MAENPDGQLMAGGTSGSLQSMAGETVWITGASSGIGRQLALAMARAGARVLASARSREALSALAQQHSGIHALPFDVTDPASAEAVGEALRGLTAHLDRVILNAGTCEYFDISQPDWGMPARVMEVNFLGAVRTLEVAMPLLVNSQRRGHIVGVVSLATAAPFTRAEAYGASKAALQYFLDSLRTDLVAREMDVTVINPGFVKTPLTDKNDFAMPFLQPVEQAAEKMLHAIVRRPRRYDFPHRLKWLLAALTWIPGFWYGVVAPRMQKS